VEMETLDSKRLLQRSRFLHRVLKTMVIQGLRG
jgi:hypothetical protein